MASDAEAEVGSIQYRDCTSIRLLLALLQMRLFGLRYSLAASAAPAGAGSAAAGAGSGAAGGLCTRSAKLVWIFDY
jgi:hypothetical protein